MFLKIKCGLYINKYMYFMCKKSLIRSFSDNE